MGGPSGHRFLQRSLWAGSGGETLHVQGEECCGGQHCWAEAWPCGVGAGCVAGGPVGCAGIAEQAGVGEGAECSCKRRLLALPVLPALWPARAPRVGPSGCAPYSTLLSHLCSRGWGHCLDDPPPKDVIELPSVLPGVLYDMDHQCRLQYGASSVFCKDMDVSVGRRGGGGARRPADPLGEASGWVVPGPRLNSEGTVSHWGAVGKPCFQS